MIVSFSWPQDVPATQSLQEIITLLGYGSEEWRCAWCHGWLFVTWQAYRKAGRYACFSMLKSIMVWI